MGMTLTLNIERAHARTLATSSGEHNAVDTIPAPVPAMALIPKAMLDDGSSAALRAIKNSSGVWRGGANGRSR